MENIRSTLDNFLQEQGLLKECSLAAAKRLITCGSYKHWEPDTISAKMGFKEKTERLCLRPLDMSFPCFAQDGRAIMTMEHFGCILHEKKVAHSQIPDIKEQ